MKMLSNKFATSSVKCLPLLSGAKPRRHSPTCVVRASSVQAPGSSTSVTSVTSPSHHNILEKALSYFRDQVPRFLGALVIAAMLVLSVPGMSEAARSGGRSGGSSFSSARSYSGSSYGGSRSYGGNTMSSRQGGPNVVNRTTVVAPSFGFGYSPFGFYQPAPVVVTGNAGGGGAIFTFLILGIFAFVAFQAVTGGFGGDDYDEFEDPDDAPMSVVKLQVGLLGSARELQRDLNRMGNTVDTSSPQGLHYLLQETVLSLRRNPQYAMYGKTELTKLRGLDNAEAGFNRVSMEERSKFQKETLSNVGGRTTRGVAKVNGDGINEMIVVTVIAAIDGKLTPADMNSQEELKTNLELLGSVPSDRLLALEVLWTPQDENDYFTRDELVTDYPTLNML